MAQKRVLACYGYYWTALLFLALTSSAPPPLDLGNHAPPALLNGSTASNMIRHCYSPDSRGSPGIQPTLKSSCLGALRVLVLHPDYLTRFRFSKNPRVLAAKQVPTGWQLGEEAECRIILNCVNDKDSFVLRYADVAKVARGIIANCVDRINTGPGWPMYNWGGVDEIPGSLTFYVAVARPFSGVGEVNGSELANGTLMGGLITSL